MMMRLKEQMYDDEKPKIVKIKDHSRGSGFVEFPGKKIKAKFLQNSCLRGKIQGEWTVEQG